jgi:hypothetical protein
MAVPAATRNVDAMLQSTPGTDTGYRDEPVDRFTLHAPNPQERNHRCNQAHKTADR